MCLIIIMYNAFKFRFEYLDIFYLLIKMNLLDSNFKLYIDLGENLVHILYIVTQIIYLISFDNVYLVLNLDSPVGGIEFNLGSLSLCVFFLLHIYNVLWFSVFEASFYVSISFGSSFEVSRTVSIASFGISWLRLINSIIVMILSSQINSGGVSNQ